VAVYKSCSQDACTSSAVLKAIDNTVSDDVDVISISIGAGGSPQQAKFLDDPIALGAFHAHQRGVLVVCSAGNDGPDPYMVVNTAPWILGVLTASSSPALFSAKEPP
jgi:subtilisin family serine protease